MRNAGREKGYFLGDDGAVFHGYVDSAKGRQITQAEAEAISAAGKAAAPAIIPRDMGGLTVDQIAAVLAEREAGQAQAAADARQLAEVAQATASEALATAQRAQASIDALMQELEKAAKRKG